MIPQTSPGSGFRGRALSHLRRLSFNAVLQIGSQVLPLLAGAAAIPVIYRNIGRDEFGILTIGLSVLGLFSLLDLGLGRASVRFMARAFADADPARAASIFVHSAVLLGGFALLLCLGLYPLTPLIVSRWMQGAGGQQQILIQCLYILAAAVPFAGLTSVFRSVLEAREDFRTIGIVQSILGVLTYLLPLALSFVTHDVRVMIAAVVICRILACLAFLVSASLAWRGRFPWHDIDMRSEHEFRQFSLWTVISNVVGTGIVYGDRALLVRLFGLGEITFYNVPLELLSRMMIIVNSAATVAFPALARFTGSQALLERVSGALMGLLSAVVGIVLLAVSLLTPAGLNVWLGAEFRDHSALLVRILLVGLAFQSVNVMSLATLNARGFARPITLMHLVETPLYFAALYACGSRFGLSAVALVWTSRLVLEYFCLAGFKLYIGARGSARWQAAGIGLSACNFIPLVLVADGAQLAALVVSGVCTAGCVSWAVSQLRAAQAHASGPARS